MDNQFPFFYGPKKETYSYLLSDLSLTQLSDLSAKSKVIELYNKITLSEGYKEKGSGLVWTYTPPKLGILKNISITEVNKRDYLVNPVTYSVMGSDKI